jgi:catechol 2,3-dioxygenase-like lactoylglutathione lyase family enzyme
LAPAISSEKKKKKHAHSSGDMVSTTAGLNKAAAQGGGLRLASLNHISVVCRSLESSLAFYCDVLGFFPIRRPGSFDFDGAWYVRRPRLISYVRATFLDQSHEIYDCESNFQAVQLRDRRASAAGGGPGGHAAQEDRD